MPVLFDNDEPEFDHDSACNKEMTNDSDEVSDDLSGSAYASNDSDVRLVMPPWSDHRRGCVRSGLSKARLEADHYNIYRYISTQKNGSEEEALGLVRYISPNQFVVDHHYRVRSSTDNVVQIEHTRRFPLPETLSVLQIELVGYLAEVNIGAFTYIAMESTLWQIVPSPMSAQFEGPLALSEVNVSTHWTKAVIEAAFRHGMMRKPDELAPVASIYSPAGMIDAWIRYVEPAITIKPPALIEQYTHLWAAITIITLIAYYASVDFNSTWMAGLLAVVALGLVIFILVSAALHGHIW